MRKLTVIVIIFSLFFGVNFLYAEAPEVFINTDPINADVYLKNDLIGKTPLRLNNLAQGKIRIRIEKSGYETLKKELIISGDSRQNYFYNLTPLHIQLVISQKNQDVYINEKNVGQTPLEINYLPAGTYEVERRESGVSISYKGYRDIRRMNKIETFFSAGLLLFSFAGMKHYQSIGNEKAADSLEFSTFIFGGLLGYNLLRYFKLHNAAREQLGQMTAIEVERFRADSARSYFTSGMELVGREQWNDALLKFNFVANVFPDSEYTSISVYEIGYCYYKLEDYQKSSQYFEMSVYDFPLYEIFPYSVYYLLDSELSTGEPYQASTDYHNLRPIYLEDPSGELQKEYYRVFTDIYSQTGESDSSILTDLHNELDNFLNRYTDSSSYPDIYLLKGKLLYKYLDREEGIRILNDIKTRYNYDKNIMNELDSILNVR